MKKKWLCLVLAVLAILPFTLTGCTKSEGSKEIEAESRTIPLTLTLYGITNESTTQEAIEAVQEAMNVYTEGQYNTHIILKLYPEKDYYDVLDKKVEEIEKILAEEAAELKRKRQEAKELRKQGITTEPETTVPDEETELETYYDKFHIVRTVYPEENQKQLDIFMVTDFHKLQEYDDSRMLASLNASLSGDCRLLNTYINPAFLESASIDDYVLGIPCNTIIGEYQYFLINKELCDKYYYDPASINTIPALMEYVNDMKVTEPSIETLYNVPEPMTASFLGSNLFGKMINNLSNEATYAMPEFLPGNYTYRQHMGYIQDMKDIAGEHIGTADMLPEGKTFAAACLTGGPYIVDRYSDEYYVVTYRKPLLDQQEVPGTMFCVSNYSKDADRCMTIITALNTNATLRNLFQYGIEGVNYKFDDDTGLVKMLNDSYSMEIENTGNLFLLYPNEEMDDVMLTYAANDWAYGKLQNQELQKSPYIDFIPEYITKDNYLKQSEMIEIVKDGDGNIISPKKYPLTFTEDQISGLVKLSEKYQKQLDAFKGNSEELKNLLSGMMDEMKKNDLYVEVVDEKNLDSIFNQYYLWWKYLYGEDDVMG